MENGDKIQFAKDIASLQTDMNNVKSQVTNHLPTAIKDVKEEVGDIKLSVNKINLKLAYWSGIIIAGITIVEWLMSK